MYATHVDAADLSNVASTSSAINMPCVSGMVNVAELFGVPLKTLEDIDDLTKGIEFGKYEVWSGMTSYKRKEVMDTLFAMWDVVNPISSKLNSYANAASGASVVINKHDATSIKPPIKLTKPVVILGVSIASKEELIGLVDKIDSGALDDVISGLTTAERQDAHALVLELARGFDYVNSDSDTSSEEPIRDTPDMVSHIDDIVKSVSIQDKPSSYVGAAGGSTPEPRRTFIPYLQKICVKVSIFLYQEGLVDVLENGPWMIRNSPIILKKWSMNTRLCKKELTRILVLVKIHDVPMQVLSEDDLSIIASQIGKLIMLDFYTSLICIESWGRSSFARCLIEINAGDVLKESLTVGVPLIEDSGFTIETINIEYE
ncbi:zinc knuckle CX2CX4HX4C containing protein [Tanacetum coccineum]